MMRIALLLAGTLAGVLATTPSIRAEPPGPVIVSTIVGSVPAATASDAYPGIGTFDFVDASTGYAMFGTTLYRTDDSGGTWSPKLTIGRVTALSFPAVNRGWVKQGRQLLEVVDGGTRIASARPISADTVNIAFREDGRGWLFGRRSAVAIQADTGTLSVLSWPCAGFRGGGAAGWNGESLVGLCDPGPVDRERGARAVQSGLAGSWPTRATLDVIVRSHGQSRDVPVPTPHQLTFTDASHGWAVGDRGVFATDDGGRSWTTLFRPGGVTNLDGIDFVDSGHGFMSAFGGLYASADGGRSWTKKFPPTGQRPPCGTSSPGIDTAGPLEPDVVLLRLGRGWQRLASVGTTVTSADFVNPLVGFVTTIFNPFEYYNSGRPMYLTGDGGRSWHRFPNSPDGAVRVDFRDMTHGLVDTVFGQRYLTEDGGQSWQRVAKTPVGAPHQIGPSVYWRVHGGQYATSTDSGLTWAGTGIGRGDTFILYPDGRAWAFTHSRVLSSTDFGRTWTEHVTVGADIASLTSVTGDQLCVTDRAGRVLSSVDAGRTWTVAVDLALASAR